MLNIFQQLLKRLCDLPLLKWGPSPLLAIEFQTSPNTFALLITNMPPLTLPYPNLRPAVISLISLSFIVWLGCLGANGPQEDMPPHPIGPSPEGQHSGLARHKGVHSSP